MRPMNTDSVVYVFICEATGVFNKISLLTAEILVVTILRFLQNRSISSVIDLIQVNCLWGIIIEIFQESALRMRFYMRH